MALWIVATPIGTLDDLSPRAREVLASADRILCEDTRTTRRLLSAVDIPAPPLEALHAHNEAQRAEAAVAWATEGEVVLVSDAGTPVVSDPGRLVVRACQDAGVTIQSVPGPSALATALSVAGQPVAPSCFLGFPPRKKRSGWVAEALARHETLVIYEAPTRVTDLVRRMAEVDPAREITLCRELSKRFEEHHRAPAAALHDWLKARGRVRGECVLVVGPSGTDASRGTGPTEVLDEGASLKDVAAVLAGRLGIKKRTAYQALLRLEQELRDA